MPNTVKQNLQRLQQARTAIANSIVAKGGTVPTGDGLEEFAADISTIAPYEMTGELPLTFKSDGEELRDYVVYGKTSKNLFDISVFNNIAGLIVDGNTITGAASTFESNFGLNTNGIPLMIDNQCVLSFDAYTDGNASSENSDGLLLRLYYTDGTWSQQYVLNSTTSPTHFEIQSNSNKIIQKLCVSYWNYGNNIWHLSNIMLNAGSTALPYEPYYAGIGERTANLLFKKIDNASIDTDGAIRILEGFAAYVAEVTENQTYTLSGNTDIPGGYDIGYYTAEPSLNSISYNGGRYIVSNNKTFRAPINGYVACRANMTDTEVMLNLGSTALPYEPYGYKIPITCGNTTTNLYTPDKLYEGDTLTYADTGTAIPTVDGVNVIDTTLNTKFEMDIQYGDFPIYDNINAAINTLKGTETTYKPADMADEILDAIPDVEVSGAVASITDAAKYAAEKLEFRVEPVQSGSGDPSPTNVRPISGWTECNWVRCGVNIWDEEWEVGDINDSGNTIAFSYRFRSKNFIPCTPLTTYYLNNSSEVISRLFYYDANKEFISFEINPYNKEFTTPSNCFYLKFRTKDDAITYNHDISINYPATDTEYHPYQGTSIHITFPTEAGTVYGGKVDVANGKLLAYPEYDSYNGETLTGEWISSMDAYVEGTTPTIGAQVVDLSGVGTEYDITPQQVQMLLGENNVWCDTGDTTLEYKVDLGRYIEKSKASQVTPQLSLSRQAVSLDEGAEER